MSPAVSRLRRWPLWVFVALVLLGVGVGAYRARKPGPHALTIVVSGDTAGWIMPCGCTSNQSGGLLRRGSFVQEIGGEVIVVDVGGAPGGTSDYQKVKFEAILKGERAMGLAVHNLGGPEVALGAEYLRRAGQELGAPFVSANVLDGEGKPLAEPVRIIEKAGRRVAFIGVLSPKYARAGVQVGEPREAVLRTVADVRGRCDSLIVLAYLPQDELEQLAANLPEVDAVVGGPTGQSIKPRPVGPTLLAAATNKGKFVIQLNAPLRGERGWTGDVVELNGRFADDPTQQTNLRRYVEDLARRDFPASTTGFAPSLPPGLPASYRFAGTQSCLECHKADCAVWEKSKHGHAWQTLTERGFHVDSYCQKCHTTGYGQPGGFETVARSEALHNVGCESCHGPSLAHNRNPRVRTPFAARDQCITCHDHENSPTFAYEQFWPRIMHGKKQAAE